MKRVNKLAAAVALALSAGMIAPNANAVIELESNGRGDALIFPVYEGRIQNYFTVMNSDNRWIQAHVRFRGAGWTTEMLDFDIILSPGDVWVFRLADIDGDGYWEIDQSLDPQNFAWAGMQQNCQNESTGATMENCIDQNPLLIPPTNNTITEEILEHQRHVGYIEVIGEGVFLDNGRNPTHSLMQRLADNAGQMSDEGQREVSSPSGAKGVSLWSWVDAQNATYDGVNIPTNYHLTRTAMDVGNALSGTAFLTLGGSTGLSYNAEALVNFRTSMNAHRVDNYDVDTAVIIHDENSVGPAGGDGPGVSAIARSVISPYGDYVYGFDPEVPNEDNAMESRISFNNTWGPTMADGDDHALTLLPYDAVFGDDSWDINFTRLNSVAEVEEAIFRDGQSFSSFYFHNGSFANDGMSLSSWYFVAFPTKFYYGESPNYYGTTSLRGSGGYTQRAATSLLSLGKPVAIELWDINENPATASVADCPTSPCLPGEVVTPALGQELTNFDISWVKSLFTAGQNFTMGRFVLGLPGAPTVLGNKDFPGLAYTFEVSTGAGLSINHWRSMHR